MNKDIWTEISKELSESSILELHGLIRKRLHEEDNNTSYETYGVREYKDWKKQADIFEEAMLYRKIDFTPIEW